MASERKISYEELEADLEGILDEVAREHEVVLVEKNGHIFSVGLAEGLPRRHLLPPHDPDALRKAIQESAGALKGIDIDEFKAELREMREQDSKGRPA
jgi:hypothetical protein